MNKLRLTATQKAILGMLRDNNGAGEVFSGSRVLLMNRESGRASCNIVSIYFLHSYGLMEHTGGKLAGGSGPQRITHKGRLAHERGWHDPDEEAC